MDALFNAESVAIFGASGEQGKIGKNIMNNLRANDYIGKVYPINPSSKYENKKILGYDVYKSLNDVNSGEKIDLGVIALPARYVKDAIIECVDSGLKSAIIITAGFGEMGKEGKFLEEEITEIAERGILKFVGPNTMGIWSENKSLNINITFLTPSSGEIAFISQSGSSSIAVTTILQSMGVGLRYLVSTGNEASLTFEDYLEFFIQDNGVKQIIGILEGLRKPKKFTSLCKKNDGKKPIIILKVGTTKIGKKAASSHTGSITGSTDIYNSIFKQAGIIKANSIEQLVDLTRAFHYYGDILPKNNNLGIIMGGGGMGILTADKAFKAGLNVADLSEDSINKINEILPSYWSKMNPVDTVGIQDLTAYTKIEKILLESNNFDALIMNVLEIKSILEQSDPKHEEGKENKKMMLGIMNSMEKSLARQQIKVMKNSNKPVIFVSHLYPFTKLFRIFEKKKTLIVRSPDAAAFVLKNLCDFYKFKNKI